MICSHYITHQLLFINGKMKLCMAGDFVYRKVGAATGVNDGAPSLDWSHGGILHLQQVYKDSQETSKIGCNSIC